MCNPQDTYALVVGIEKYKPDSYCDNLDGSALDALRFTEWLLSKNVPPENICLFISECEKNKAEIDERINKLSIVRKKATREDLFEAITETIRDYGDNGELLYIYWSGHGASNGIGDRRFFYDDGTQNLCLNNLLLSLKTDIYGFFDQQILIFDACATYYSKKASKSLSGEVYPVGNPNKNCHQEIIFATKEGELAKNIEGEKTGLFSKVLLDELSKENELLLPQKLKVIQNRIIEQFKAKYADEPSPITLSYTDNPEGYCHEQQEFPNVYLNQAAKKYSFLERSWNNLTKILSLVDWQIISSCCIKVLSHYSNDPHSIASQLYNINSQLSEERDWQILKQIQQKGYEVLKEILLKKKYQENNQFQIPLVLVFAQNLLQEAINEIAKNKLNKWINYLAQEFNINLEEMPCKTIIKAKNQDKYYSVKLKPFLLIIFQTLSSSEFIIEAELIFLENDFAENKLKSIDISQGQYNNIHCQDICEKCCELIAKSNKYLIDYKNANELTIEFFYPRKYLLELNCPNQPIEGGDSPWFGSKYKTTTRYYERCRDYTYRKDLILNWQYFEELVSQLAEDINKNTQDKDKTIVNKMFCLNLKDEKVRWKKLRRNLSDEKKIGLNLDLPLLNSDYKKYIDEFLNTILRCGLPFSFWLRDKSLEALKLSESQKDIDLEFKDFLKFEHFQQLETLLEYVRKVRDDSYVEDDALQDQYLGYHLGFLCDNPHRLPSWFDEEKGDDIYTFKNL